MLYFIVAIEGYVVLAAELLAIRLLLPFVGSGTEIIAIVVGAVLLPLAAGYHIGGHRAHTPSVRKILLRNILSALGILALGLSYVFLQFLFAGFDALHMPRLWQASLYVLLFIVYPIFLLAQTVPLISHYFRHRQLSKHTGRMLFFSTAGSFFGSIVSTLVLMNWIGVHLTSVATLGLLVLLTIILARRFFSADVGMALLLLALAVALNHPTLLRSLSIVSNNGYNTVVIRTVKNEPGNLFMEVNRSSSSKLAQREEDEFPYLRYIHRNAIGPIMKANPPRDILVLGAGGFTLGRHDVNNHYTYVDIDPALQKVSEEHFLPEKLKPNHQFEPISARAFLRQSKEKYDLIVIDTYTHIYSVPMETTTVEFLQSIKDHLKPGGVVIANIAASPTFSDKFSVRYHNGFTAVFGNYTRQVFAGYNVWRRDGKALNNILYIYYDTPESHDRSYYTDDRNRYSLDRQ